MESPRILRLWVYDSFIEGPFPSEISDMFQALVTFDFEWTSESPSEVEHKWEIEIDIRTSDNESVRKEPIRKSYFGIHSYYILEDLTSLLPFNGYKFVKQDEHVVNLNFYNTYVKNVIGKTNLHKMIDDFEMEYFITMVNVKNSQEAKKIIEAKGYIDDQNIYVSPY